MNVLIKSSLSISAVAIVFASGIYLGSAQKTISPAAEPMSAPEQNIQEPTPEVKTLFTPEDLQAINLTAADVPSAYVYRPEKSGLNYDALSYTGDLKMAQQIQSNGWLATHESYFETVDANGNPIMNIRAALSIYQDINRVDCMFKINAEEYRAAMATQVETSRKFGDDSFLFGTYMSDPRLGELPVFHLKFYYGNVFANFEIAGPKETFSQQEIESYATLIEQRFKEVCPNCVNAPVCAA